MPKKAVANRPSPHPILDSPDLGVRGDGIALAQAAVSLRHAGPRSRLLGGPPATASKDRASEVWTSAC